jgi:NADH dehydrogenase FAD-containing subunit
MLWQVLEADLVLWTAGSSPVTKEGVSKQGLKLPFPSTTRGAVKTDATLRVVDHPRVFALGDVSGAEVPEASTSGSGLPATAQVWQLTSSLALCIRILHKLCEASPRPRLLEMPMLPG